MVCVLQGAASADTILFIDEIHTLVGAGAAEGAIDAANLLKPSLARGELQCIGATTVEEDVTRTRTRTPSCGAHLPPSPYHPVR